MGQKRDAQFKKKTKKKGKAMRKGKGAIGKKSSKPQAGTSKRIKVLFLSAAGMVGGAERSLYELLSALPEDRIEAIACVPPESPLARMFSLAEIPVYPIPLRRFRRTLHPIALAGQLKALFLASQSIRRLVKKLDIDVIHANTDSAALIAWEVHRESKCPFIWHCRDLRPLGPMAKLLSRSSAGAVAISKTVSEHLKTQGVPQDRIRCILNGVDLFRFHSAEDRIRVRERTRKYLGVDADTPLLIDIGAWVPWKRHELFLEMLVHIRKRNPAVKGMLVGGDLFNENEAYVQQLESGMDERGLDEDALLILDQRDDIPDLLAASDMLVSSSGSEPFGRVLAEAGAAGIPVVSTRSGAKPEIIIEGKTGFLTEDDPARMAAACLKLLEDPALMKQLGENARSNISKHFDVRRTSGELADFLFEIADA